MDDAETITTELFLALGRAASKIWSSLPQEAQHQLFEEAISSQGEELRQRLAIFLHQKHPPIADSIKARAILEPDSLGG